MSEPVWMVHIRRRMERSWRVVGAEDWFFYHAWNATASGTHDGSRGRFGLLDRIEWESGWPHLGDGTPTDGTQRWPGAE